MFIYYSFQVLKYISVIVDQLRVINKSDQFLPCLPIIFCDFISKQDAKVDFKMLSLLPPKTQLYFLNYSSTQLTNILFSIYYSL